MGEKNSEKIITAIYLGHKGEGFLNFVTFIDFAY